MGKVTKHTQQHYSSCIFHSFSHTIVIHSTIRSVNFLPGQKLLKKQKQLAVQAMVRAVQYSCGKNHIFLRIFIII